MPPSASRNPNRPLSPHLGIWRWGPHMLVSILHRLTGAALTVAGMALLCWWLIAIAAGPDAYATFATVEARLARQLIYLADLGGRMTEHGVRVPGRFRQVELANLLGTTSRSIISTLNAWREKGVVTYDTRSAQLTIRDTAVLRDLAGG